MFSIFTGVMITWLYTFVYLTELYLKTVKYDFM